MRALVTGSAGLIGRHVAAALVARGWDVRRCDIAIGWGALTAFAMHHDPFHLVVHCAARSPHRAAIDGDPGMHAYNAMLDAAMFDWAIRTKQRRVLYLSSCAVLDGPVDGYAATKQAGEWLAHETRKAGVPVTVVRPYSGYGEDQSEDFPFRALVERARRRDDPFAVWGPGDQVRDWVHVDDVVAGALAVVDSGTEDPVSLCTGVGTSMLALAAMACEAVGYAPRFEFRLDKPAGVARRVGDPTVLHRCYTPKVTLADGIRRALGGT